VGADVEEGGAGKEVAGGEREIVFFFSSTRDVGEGEGGGARGEDRGEGERGVFVSSVWCGGSGEGVGIATLVTVLALSSS
jgi:hypothetical protein